MRDMITKLNYAWSSQLHQSSKILMTSWSLQNQSTVQAQIFELTWKTVSRACQKRSKLDLGFGFQVKLNFPPNSCIPNSAKMTMKRKRRTSKLTMDFIEANSEATRLRRLDQYLRSSGIQLMIKSGKQSRKLA